MGTDFISIKEPLLCQTEIRKLFLLFGHLFFNLMGTWDHEKTNLGYCMFVFVAVYHMLFSCVHVDGKSIFADKTVELAMREGTIKTIQSEDGDVIDCVDICKQPAFKHPLLKDHTIQMKPNSYPKGIKAEKFEPELLQGWHKSGQCPEGTIPIIRQQMHNSTRTRASVPTKKNFQKFAVDAVDASHEYAQVSAVEGNYFGASARLNVWKPATSENEFSLAQIWVLSGHENELNSMEVGWMTSSGQPTQIFIFWTTDGYDGTGCYNLECPGFVQTDNTLSLGSYLKPVSTYDGEQFEIYLNIHKDKQSRNWWLRVQDVDLGYWPSSIFTRLSDRADTITWGGEIVNLELQGRHTSTQMGSGHFSIESFRKACFFKNLGYIDESGAARDPEKLVPYVTKPQCYDLRMGSDLKTIFGVFFYFGGPGYSDKCP